VKILSVKPIVFSFM